MKELFSIISIIIIVAGVIFSTMTKGNAFSWSWWSSLGNETHSSKSSNIQMAGTDGRAYDTVVNGVRCISIVTSEGIGTSCDWSNVTNKNGKKIKH